MKRALHTYKGLNTDLARDTISKGFYIDALDIRLTTDVGESNGSITNIKGNVNYFSLPTSDPDFSMIGTMEIIGATSIRETIILYCADDTGTNGWIFKVEYSSIDQTLTSGPTVVYKSNALNFKKAHPIEAQGRFENDSIQRLYWTDYNNFFRSINIKDSLLNLPYGDPNYPPVGNIDVFPSIEYTQPILESIGTGGSLQVGMYQYSYRLKTIDGKQTLVSPPGNMIHVVGDSDTLTSSRMYSGNASYNGADPQITTKAITIKIDTTEYANVFAEVELICAIYTELTDTAQIFSVETVGIDSDSTEIFITHTGTEDSLTELEIDEFTIRTLPFKTPKTITPKDNSLIVANIKGASFSISELLADGETFNAITARYNNQSPPATPVSPPLGPTPAQTRAAELQNAFNVVGQANTVGYNQDAHWDIDWHADSNQYKFQSNGARLGGTGVNISYHFHTEPVTLDNTGLAWLDNTNLSTNNTNLADSYGIYPNNSFSNNASPFNSGLIRGYKRGETYRFGVVFYDKKGNASFVEYIGDIKFPDISDLDSVDTAASTVPNVKYFPLSLETSCDAINPQPRSCITTGYNLGVKFTFNFTSCPTLQDKIDSYQIVRVKRDIQDSKRICSGIMKVGAQMAVGDAPDNDDEMYDLRDPEGSDNINHLFAYHRLRDSNNNVTGNAFGFNGTFDTINNTRINGNPQVVNGAFLHLASSDITYNYPGIRDAISGDSCLLMTGAYGQYFSRIESAQSTIGASETFTGSGVAFGRNIVQELNSGGTAIRKSFDILHQQNTEDDEDLGNIKDFRRKLRSVARLDKSTAAKSMEAIKQFISTQVVEYTSNKQDDSDMGTNLNKGIGSYEGRADTGTAVVDLYFRNFYAVLPHVFDINHGPDLNNHMDTDGTAAKITTLWAQGATGLLATMKKIDNDPLTGDSLSSVSSYNAFYTGTGTTYTGASQINVLQGNAYPLNKSVADENRTSTPILDILNPRKEVYGGFTESALENNIFMPASPVIPITTLTPEVFGGDIFLNMFTFQESTAWLKHDEPGAFYNRGYDSGTGNNNNVNQRFEDNMTSTIVMPTESRVNIDLAWGCTTKRDVEFDVSGGNNGFLRTYWRKETDNKTTQFGKSKSMYIDAYNFVNSRESDTVSFFVKPSNFILGSDLNDIRAFISQVKFNGEEIDSWTKYGINDFLDVDDHGPINKIVNWRDEVYFFQNTGMGVYSINPRAITSAGDGIPTELGSAKGLTDHKYISTNHGSIHQWGVKETDMGIYIFDGTHRKIFKVGEGAQPLSEIKGIHSFLKNMEGDFLLHKDEDGDNPILGKGMHIAKDPINNEIIFTFRGTQTTMPLAERTYYPAGVTVLYEPGPGYAIVTNSYMSGASSPPNYSYLVAQLFSPAADGGGAATEEAKGPNLKSTSLVYDEVAGEFTTRFSACPTMYIENENILLSPNPSAVVGQPSIYRHNVGNWGEFYDNPAEMSIKLVLNENADLNKVLRTIEFNSIIRDDAKVIKRNATISAFQIETEYQDTGKILFSSGRIKRRFDKWRLKIPRDTIDTSGKDRLRSTYFMLTLYFDNEVNRELILDRIMYYYDIQEF